MKNLQTLIAASLVMLMLSSHGADYVSASSIFVAPTWLKIGTYAEYTFPSGTIHLSNDTQPLGFESVDFINANFRWECLNLNETVAKLKVTLNFTDTERKTMQLTNEIFVNTLNRGVYLQNGTLIGTTRLWLPANPAPNEDIIMWDVPPDRVTVKPANTTTRGMTPQGSQKAFQISAFGDGTISGKSVSFHGLWDLDTGVMIDDYPRDSEPVYTALGIKKFMPSVTVFSDTNIDLGPSGSPIGLHTIFAAVAISVAIVITTIAIVRRKKRRAEFKTTHPSKKLNKKQHME